MTDVTGQHWLNRLSTIVKATVALSSGAVGNTTFGLWAACLAAAAICITFILAGDPIYALAALVILAIWYLLYQRATWKGIQGNPDAGVAGEHAYAQIVQTREGMRTIPGHSGKPLLGSRAHAERPHVTVDRDE